jgi:hypothetical protein
MNAIDFNVTEALSSNSTDAASLLNLSDIQLALVGGGNADISLN